MKIEEKLSVNKFEIDREVHITIDEKLCEGCLEKKCLYVCPAECYALRNEKVIFSYEGCLECGSCRVACERNSINWVYPRGGFGICYQFG